MNAGLRFMQGIKRAHHTVCKGGAVDATRMERGDIVSCLSDEQLAHRAAAGRLDCFEALLSRYRDRVYRLCYRMAGNAEDAEDWAQECFVRLYRQLGRYDPGLPFASWLLRVVSNTCINLAKGRARLQTRLALGLAEDMQRMAAVPGPEQAAISQEEARLISAAVEALPPLLRQAVVLRVLEDLSFRELAEVLDVPLQTAATRVRRALIQVRERLNGSGMEVRR